MSKFTKEQTKWLNARTIKILHTLASNEGLTLKQVGLYQMPNKGNHLIIDQYPTFQVREIVDSAYRLAKEELLKNA